MTGRRSGRLFPRAIWTKTRRLHMTANVKKTSQRVELGDVAVSPRGHTDNANDALHQRRRTLTQTPGRFSFFHLAILFRQINQADFEPL